MYVHQKYVGFGILAGLAAGVGIGYFIGKRVKVKYAPVDQYIYTTVETDTVEYVEDGDGKKPIYIEKVVIDPEVAEQIQAQINLNREIEAIHDFDEDHARKAVNVFGVNDKGDLPEWDEETQVANRDPLKPYVISKDEFMDDILGYDQDTVTYYMGDDILADEHDIPIWNWPDKLGSLHFGLGSDDPNVVYVRNDVLHQEWEVLKHTGSFEAEVTGLVIEQEYEERDLKHSNSLHKFRDL